MLLHNVDMPNAHGTIPAYNCPFEMIPPKPKKDWAFAESRNPAARKED